MSAIDSTRHPLLFSISQGAQWPDEREFLSHTDQADEYEQWLQFGKAKGGIDRFLPRLKQSDPKQRDATFAEISVAYFLENRCALPVQQWEPEGAGLKTGEFLVKLPDGRNMFIEVKAPGWDGEVFRAEGPYSPRFRKPKYINAEAKRSASWLAVREAVKKAHQQVPDNCPTLLVLRDNLFVDLNNWPPLATRIALYCHRSNAANTWDYSAEDGSFVGRTHEKLGALAALNVQFQGSSVQYLCRIYDNPDCLEAVAVPPGIFGSFPRFGPDH